MLTWKQCSQTIVYVEEIIFFNNIILIYLLPIRLSLYYLVLAQEVHLFSKQQNKINFFQLIVFFLNLLTGAVQFGASH